MNVKRKIFKRNKKKIQTVNLREVELVKKIALINERAEKSRQNYSYNLNNYYQV